MKTVQMANYKAAHFDWKVSEKVATITLNRPERKNPITFESYLELGQLFRELAYATDIKAVVFTGAGGNFCSGGDVHDIIGPLTRMDMGGLLAFTRMTGDPVKAVRHCPQPVIAAADARGLTRIPASALVGGTRAWREAGFELESGEQHLAAETDDVYYRPYDRRSQIDQAMHDYLAWEVALVDQLKREDYLRFDLRPA